MINLGQDVTDFLVILNEQYLRIINQTYTKGLDPLQLNSLNRVIGMYNASGFQLMIASAVNDIAL